MSALTKFRDHCAAMATAGHKPECPSLTARKPCWSPMWPIYNGAREVVAMGLNGPEPTWVPPTCAGCVTNADRALFAAMAGECATYIDARLDLTERAK